MKKFWIILVFGLFAVAPFASKGWTYPWGHSCNGLAPTAVSTGAMAAGSTDCNMKINTLTGDTSVVVTFQETFANLPFCQCTSAGGSPLGMSAVASATATNGGGDILTVTWASAGVTSAVCSCVPN